MYYVYHLYSKKINRYYIGQTDSLDYRFWEHNTGQEKYTKRGSPWTLIGYVECVDRARAVQLESKLKKAKNKKYVYWHIQ